MSDRPAESAATGDDRAIARVNLRPEDEQSEEQMWVDEPAVADDAPVGRTWPARAIPFGIVALIVIIVSMLLILQGSYSMLPD